MISLPLLRYGFFAFFMLFNGLIGTLSALNLGVSTNTPGTEDAKAVDIFLITLTISSVLLIFPLLGIEITRKGAITTRVWFELLWVAVLAALQLGGAIAGTLRIPVAFCHDRIAGFECSASIALLVFTWINACLHLGYFGLLLMMSLLSREVNIWQQHVCDYAWPGTHNAQQHDLRATFKKYEGSLGSLESATTYKEKGYDLFQHHKQASYDQLDAFQVRGAEPLNQTDMSRLARSDDFRMANHPYQIAAPIQISLPNAPAPTKQPAAATYYDWETSPFKKGPFGDSITVDTPGFSPAVVKTAQKAAVQQPPLSLYPQHVTNTGLTTMPITVPPPALNGRRRTSTGPARPTVVTTSVRVSGPVSAWEQGHVVGSSIDSTIRAPKHRPPPLDLSAVSNMNKAARR